MRLTLYEMSQTLAILGFDSTPLNSKCFKSGTTKPLLYPVLPPLCVLDHHLDAYSLLFPTSPSSALPSQDPCLLHCLWL